MKGVVSEGIVSNIPTVDEVVSRNLGNPLREVELKIRKPMCDSIMLFLLAVGVALFVPSMTMAETPDSEETASAKNSADSPYTLEPIVITAEKRETHLQQTPVAVTVFTAQDIEDGNYKTIHDVLAQVPNLMLVGHIGSSTRLSFRGALTSMGTETTPFVMYIDGVPVDSYSSLDASLVNIKRIEVLRGAQSTLYGKNAFAGVVNIISKKPDNTPTGKVFLDVGTEYSYGMGATISGPVVEDKLFFSLSGSHEYRDGYMDIEDSSVSNNKRNVRLKGQLRFFPTDKSELNLHMQYRKYEEGPVPVIKGMSPTLESPANDGDHRNIDAFSMAAHGALDLLSMELQSITTFRHDQMTASLDTDTFLPVGFFNEYEESSYKITQELRLQNQDDSNGDVSWIAGLYGGYRNFDRTKWYTPAIPINFPHKDELFEFAPFGQVVVPLFADGLKFTAGLRWQYVNRKAEIKTVMGDTTLFSDKPNETWTEFLPKVVLSYDITDDHMVYAGVNRSFLPGGFSRQVIPGVTDITYKPQYAWNYELGAKTTWLEKRLNANLVLFYSKIKDMHVLSWDIVAGGPVATNAGAVTSYGAEFEATMRFTPKLLGRASVGYTHAEFDEFDSIIFGDNSGRDVHYTPEYNGNVSMVYRGENGFMGQVSVLHIGEMYWDAANNESQEAVTTVDAKIGYELDAFDVYLYAKNLFDERYLTVHEVFANYSLVAPSREFGLQLVYRW